MTAATTDQAGEAPATKRSLSSRVETIRKLVKLWILPAFSAGVVLYTLEYLPLGWAGKMPDSHVWFWAAFFFIAAFYAVRQTRDLLGF